jgi:hypothetical protein
MKSPTLEKLFPKLVLIGVVIWVAGALAVYYCFPNWEIRAQFGEMFGAVSALFSGLAFAGVIYAVILQRQDMEISRKELAAQNQLISAQLVTMQESFSFERQKEALSSEPIFRTRGGSNSPTEKSCDFVNAGAAVTGFTVEAPSDFGLDFYPKDMLDRSEQGRITLKSRSSAVIPDVVLTIHYTTRLGVRKQKQLLVPTGYRQSDRPK